MKTKKTANFLFISFGMSALIVSLATGCGGGGGGGLAPPDEDPGDIPQGGDAPPETEPPETEPPAR